MKNTRGAHWKMVRASLFVVICYSFVKRAATTFLIRDHSLGASSSALNFQHVQNCARNLAHKCTRRKDATHAQGTMDQRPIHAIHTEHSLDIRCMFIGWDVANTHRDIELPPYWWCNWWQARQLQVSFKQRLHMLGLSTVTTTKGSTRSVVFMAFVDADCKFVWADICGMGSTLNA